jgi:cell division protein FtsB
MISKDGTYYINELPIIATLTKAIQEQQAQIEELKNEIKKLKGEQYE